MSQTPLFPVDRPLSLTRLCEAVGGVRKRVGEADLEIRTVAALDGGDAHSLAFCRYHGDRGRAAILASPAAAMVCAEAPDAVAGRSFIEVEDPRGWFIDALSHLNPAPERAGRHPTASIADGAQIGEDVEIGAYSVIEAGAVIGDRCRIGPHVLITGAARLAAGVRVQAHGVIGTDGLSFHHRPDGEHVFLPHLGHAVIGENSSIGAHVTVVRGILKNTVIGAGCEIGNSVNIGHNCVIGEACFISSGAVLTGGVTLGDGARLAAGVQINAHCSIGRRAQVGLGSVVVKDIGDDKKVFGNPARPLPTLRGF